MEFDQYYNKEKLLMAEVIWPVYKLVCICNMTSDPEQISPALNIELVITHRLRYFGCCHWVMKKILELQLLEFYKKNFFSSLFWLKKLTMK